MKNRQMKPIINEILKEKGWTQRELANIANVPEPAVSRYCRGANKSYNMDHLFAIARTLNRKVDDLFKEDNG